MTDLPANDATPEGMTAERSVRITTGSRLHFGLLDTMDPFGGVGVMIDQPCTEVIVSPSDRFVCDDESVSRLRPIAERVASHANLATLPCCRVTVTSRASQHCGLGSGSQLALAAAEAFCRFLRVRVDAATLASQIAMRGQRSAVGVHGYFLGGLIFEGAAETCPLNPLINRVEVPSHWHVAIFRPTRGATSVSGQFEREQFSHLSGADAETSATLKTNIVDQMIPAAQRADFAAFTDSVHRYNEASGKLFEAVQGGPYNGAAVTDLVRALLRHGAHGVGQSSWGPGVFAWFESQQEADSLARSLPNDISLVAIANPGNSPRTVQDV